MHFVRLKSMNLSSERRIVVVAQILSIENRLNTFYKNDEKDEYESDFYKNEYEYESDFYKNDERDEYESEFYEKNEKDEYESRFVKLVTRSISSSISSYLFSRHMSLRRDSIVFFLFYLYFLISRISSI